VFCSGGVRHPLFGPRVRTRVRKSGSSRCSLVFIEMGSHVSLKALVWRSCMGTVFVYHTPSLQLVNNISTRGSRQ
jgi:hypothetical protein